MNASIKNKKINHVISLLSMILLSTFFAEGQTLKYQKVYGGYSYDYGNDLIQTTDSGYLLLCTSNSFSNSSDIYLLKVDKQGNYEWQRTYGGNQIEGACKIKFTQDGNIVMAGHTSSYLNTSYDFYLIKANTNGDTLWTKHYGTNEWDFANSMDTCADGGFIMAGKTYDTGNAYSDILIVKTDADGNEQWQKKLGGSLDDVANSIISIPNGYIICGTTSSIGMGEKDIYVIKTDLNGNIIWERTFGEMHNDEGMSCYLDNENILMIAGKITLNTYPNNFNTFLLKLRLDGSNYWEFVNTSIGTINNQIITVVPGYNKGITTTGLFNPNSPTFNDVFIFINDSMGSYNNSGTHGGSFEDYGKSIIKTLDYGYAAIGTTNSFGMGLSNIYFVKTDTLTPSVGTLSILVNLKETNRLVAAQNLVYPNPFSHSSTINIDFPASIVASNAFALKLIDQLGNEVSHQVAYTVKDNNKGSAITINNRSLSNGMYYYSLSINDKDIVQGKFTILK
jgi:hypothetical protein